MRRLTQTPDNVSFPPIGRTVIEILKLYGEKELGKTGQDA